MFNINEYRKSPDRLTDLLPWAAFVAPGVLLNKDGSLQCSLRYRGPDLSSEDDSSLLAATARLNNALKRLGSGWAVYIEAQREEVNDYPDLGHFPDAASWLIEEERRQGFSQEGAHFESSYFMTFQYLAPDEKQHRMNRWFVDNAKGQGDTDYHKVLSFFIATVERIADILKDFMVEIAFLNDTETLTYLHTTISHKRHPVKVPETPMYLDAVLADQPLTAGLAPRLGEQHLHVVSVLGFPGSSTPAMLDQLNQLPLCYRWSTRYLPVDKVDAEKILKDYKRRWFSKRKGMLTLLQEAITKSESALVDTAAVEKAQDADEALRELADDYVSYGYFTATVTVWDESPARAAEKQREVERVINGLGFTTIAETINCVEAWLSSLPGHAYANVRTPLLHSLNLSHMMPFSAIWSGPAQNSHLQAPALMTVKTTGHTPFRLVNHVGDVGHQMVVGPTGSGKSVLLNMLALQFRRYQDANVMIFDKGESFLTSTAAVAGAHFDLGQYGLAFQPLASVDDEHECLWISEWVHGLLESENVTLTPAYKDEIWQALQSLAQMPVHQRTITGLQTLVQNTVLRDALLPYTLAGPYGRILDSDAEQVCEADWQYYAMDALMDIPGVIPPLLSYLFHRLEKRFNGQPCLLILDEAWLFLDHPIFRDKIREWLKTLRKANVSVIFATQSVDDILQSQVAPALIESCPSRIFLPNDRALEPRLASAYQQLGLSERQLQRLVTAVPKRQYYFQSRQGDSLFDMALGECALAICGMNTPEHREQVKALIKQYPGKDFLPAYLEMRDVKWALGKIQAYNEEAVI